MLIVRANYTFMRVYFFKIISEISNRAGGAKDVLYRNQYVSIPALVS